MADWAGNILVLGDSLLVRELGGPSNRLCREAPVPIVSLASYRDVAAGAAGAALALAAQGCAPRLLSAAGADEEGEVLASLLREASVDARLYVARAGSTRAQTRVSSAGQLVLVLDQGASAPLDTAGEGMLLDGLAGCESDDALVICDRGDGCLTPAVLQAIERRRPAFLAVDAVDPGRYAGLRPDLVLLDQESACSLLDLGPLPKRRLPRRLFDCREALLAATGAGLVAVTVDGLGIVLLGRGSAPAFLKYRAYSSLVPGSSERVLACLTRALLAAEQPCAALASALGRPRAANGRGKREILARLSAGREHILDREPLAARLAQRSAAGDRIVFTNGCFDILHSGHTAFLAAARQLGDVLVVGLNTDASVSRLKGPGRPINHLQDRAEVLASLACVDFVVPFDEDTPEELIRLLRPDVFVKGGDYRVEELPEARLVESLGGTVRTLDYVEDHSTTSIIERIWQRGAKAGAAGS